MRVLVACEFSGIVRDAFIAKGHDALSCDLLPTEKPGPHYQGDVFDIIDQGWDMMIAHPPCTYIALCQWWRCQRDAERMRKSVEALEFFGRLWSANIPRVCLENPASMAIRVHRHHQIIQPWKFGHGECKETWLWLRKLPPLVPTRLVCGREERIHRMSPSKNRSHERSRTFPGIAKAMADQWG